MSFLTHVLDAAIDLALRCTYDHAEPGFVALSQDSWSSLGLLERPKPSRSGAQTH